MSEPEHMPRHRRTTSWGTYINGAMLAMVLIGVGYQVVIKQAQQEQNVAVLTATYTGELNVVKAKYDGELALMRNRQENSERRLTDLEAGGRTVAQLMSDNNSALAEIRADIKGLFSSMGLTGADPKPAMTRRRP